MKSASRFYFEKMTVKAVSAFMCAMEEARALNLRSIGSELILLGLVRENDNLAATLLNAWDVKYFPLKKEIEMLYPRSSAVWPGEIRLGFSCKNVLVEAEKESGNNGLDYINTKHLMLAIVRDRDSLANKSPGNIFASVAWALIWLYLLVYAYYVLTGI